MINLTTEIAGIKFQNPIWVASGTFGYGKEYQDFLNLNKIGAIVTKSVTLQPKPGNKPPRIVETAAGLLNSIGIENEGVDEFIKTAHPFLKKLSSKIIISVAGQSAGEFITCLSKLTQDDFPAAFELNFSCPNISHGKLCQGLIAQNPQITADLINKIKKTTNKKLIIKLTPNVTNISEIAKAAEDSGADAVSMVNTYMGMAIDPYKKQPVLGNIIGGLSGPAIKPLALRAVYETNQRIKIPIIGMGGIMTGLDVAEFMIAGAKAVQIGTANLVNPQAYTKILTEYKNYLQHMGR